MILTSKLPIAPIGQDKKLKIITTNEKRARPKMFFPEKDPSVDPFVPARRGKSTSDLPVGPRPTAAKATAAKAVEKTGRKKPGRKKKTR